MDTEHTANADRAGKIKDFFGRATFQSRPLLLACFFLAGCNPHGETKPESGQYEIEGVYMHNPGDYSVAVNESGELKIRRIGSVDCYDQTVKIIPDVANGKKDWVRFSVRVDPESPYYQQGVSLFEIHIHGACDINGAGWSKGKFGSGQTQIIDTNATLHP